MEQILFETPTATAPHAEAAPQGTENVRACTFLSKLMALTF
jgi:hypothetical protein